MVFVFLTAGSTPAVSSELDAGIRIESQDIRFDYQNELITSDKGITVSGDGFTLQAQAFVYRQKINSLEVWGNVEFHSAELGMKAERVTADFETMILAADAGVFTARDATLTADELAYGLDTRQARASGNVRLNWDRAAAGGREPMMLRLRSDRADFNGERMTATASGRVEVQADEFWFGGESLTVDLSRETMTSTDRITIKVDREPPLAVDGAGLALDLKSGTADVRGPVGLELAGDEPVSVRGRGDLSYDMDSGELVLSGVVQGRWRCGEIEGDGFRMTMTEAGPSWELSGRVTGVLMPRDCAPAGTHDEPEAETGEKD